jgi:hypothetical protein
LTTFTRSPIFGSGVEQVQGRLVGPKVLGIEAGLDIANYRVSPIFAGRDPVAPFPALSVLIRF